MDQQNISQFSTPPTPPVIPPAPPKKSRKWIYIFLGIIVLILAYTIFSHNSPPKPQPLKGEGLTADLGLSANGKYIVFEYKKNGGIQLYTANVDGSGVRSMGLPDNLYPTNPIYSPDGAKVIFVSYYKGFREPYTYVYTTNSDGSSLQQITKDQEHILEAIFSKDQSKIYYIKSAGFYSNGSISGARPRDYDIWVMNADGTNPQQLTQYKAYELASLQLTPDGNSLFFKYDEGFKQRFAILDLNNPGQQPTFIISNGGTSPALSPDGKSVIFSRVVDSKAPTYAYDLYKIDIATNNITRLTSLNSYATSARFYHGGNKLIFIGGLNQYQLMGINVDGTNLQAINLSIP